MRIGAASRIRAKARKQVDAGARLAKDWDKEITIINGGHARIENSDLHRPDCFDTHKRLNILGASAGNAKPLRRGSLCLGRKTLGPSRWNRYARASDWSEWGG